MGKFFDPFFKAIINEGDNFVKFEIVVDKRIFEGFDPSKPIVLPVFAGRADPQVLASVLGGAICRAIEQWTIDLRSSDSQI